MESDEHRDLRAAVAAIARESDARYYAEHAPRRTPYAEL
jgi:hypothetical protein